MKIRNRNLFFHNILLITILLVLLAPVVSASDNLKGELSGNLDVNVHVESYAKINGADISGSDWMPGTIEDGNNNFKDSFSGRSGETRWAQTQVIVGANTPVNIVFDPESFPNNNLNNRWYRIYVSSLENSNATWDVAMGSDNWNQTFQFTSDKGNIENIFNVKVQATMPQKIWEVKAGTYTGKIKITVSAL